MSASRGRRGRPIPIPHRRAAPVPLPEPVARGVPPDRTGRSPVRAPVRAARPLERAAGRMASGGLPRRSKLPPCLRPWLGSADRRAPTIAEPAVARQPRAGVHRDLSPGSWGRPRSVVLWPPTRHPAGRREPGSESGLARRARRDRGLARSLPAAATWRRHPPGSGVPAFRRHANRDAPMRDSAAAPRAPMGRSAIRCHRAESWHPRRPPGPPAKRRTGSRRRNGPGPPPALSTTDPRVHAAAPVVRDRPR
jgi:hypothetical protein